MKISIQNTLKNAPVALVMPVAKGENFETSVKHAATAIGIPADWIQQHFKGDVKEILPIPSQDKKQPRTLYLLGMGEQISFATVLKSFRYFIFQYREKLPATIGIDFTKFGDCTDLDRCVEAAVNGIMLGRYQNGIFKTEEKKKLNLDSPEANIEIFIPKGVAKNVEHAAKSGLLTAETQIRIFDLVNRPSNKKAPEDLAEWAEKSAKKHGFKATVFDKKDLKKMGMDALLAVNRGSENPARLIVVEYEPEGALKQPLKKIGLVGKGVTFDTGGLSIKPSANMHFMKSDMGGAAAILGAVELTAKLELPVHLVAAIPATDNSVDAKSIKPGDIIGSYAGKTIEVIDTDAEGRLVLADGLAYLIKNHQPDVLIDLATLTGSTVQTFGYQAAALFSNNDALVNEMISAGEICGERLWRMPLWDSYKDEIKSDVADVKNYHGKPVAGAIVAAKFLEAFVENHPAWAHLDIASVAFGDTEFASMRTATAYGVRLLTEYLRKV